MLSLAVSSGDTPVEQPLLKTNEFGYSFDSMPAATEITSDILKNPRRVVAIGDVHSDLDSFLAVLKRANLVKITKRAPVEVSIWGENMPKWVLKQEEIVSDVQWAGGVRDVLVQTGDMVDRGVDTIAVYTLLKKLEDQAEKAGGEVVPLLGNHETMRIFDNGEIDFTDVRTVTDGVVENGEYANRDEAFKETGFLGKWIRSLDTAKVVGDTLYSHAGILPEWAHGINIATINRDIRDAMNPENVAGVQIVTNPKNPLNNRRYGLYVERSICPTVQAALDNFKLAEKKNINRMVVGHTPDEKGLIRSKCDNSLLLIDVGLSKGIFKDETKRLTALEILYDNGATRINALYDNNETVELTAPVMNSKKERLME